MKIDSKLHRIYVKRSKNDDLPSNICFEADFNHKNHNKPPKASKICPKSLGRSVEASTIRSEATKPCPKFPENGFQ